MEEISWKRQEMMSVFERARKKTEAIFQAEGLPLHPYLPLRDETETRSARETGLRLIALYSLAGLSNGALASELIQWLQEIEIWKSISLVDKATLEKNVLNEAELNEVSWKQESMYMLGAVLGIVQPPSIYGESELNPIFAVIPPEIECEKFLTEINLRDHDTVLSLLDLYYCLHASIVHPELWSNGISQDLKIECIIERRRALEWVFAQGTKWEEITLDT